MKKSVKILALALVAVMMCMALVSCGKKLSGEYEALDVDLGIYKANVTYKFEGNKYEKTTKQENILGQIDTKTVEGTYEIVTNDDDKMEITLTEKDAEEGETFTFEEGEGYIKIGLMKLNKVEKK